MGVEDFQNFIQQKCPGAFVPVDLLKVAQAVGVKQRKSVNGVNYPSKMRGNFIDMFFKSFRLF